MQIVLFVLTLLNTALLGILITQKILKRPKAPDEVVRDTLRDLANNGFVIIRIDPDSIFLRGTR